MSREMPVAAKALIRYDKPMSSNFSLLSPLTRLADLTRAHLRLFTAAVLIFLSILGMVTVFRGALAEKHRTDLVVFLKGAEAASEGKNIYDTKTDRHWNYVYLPLLAVAMMPVFKLPLAVNVALWYGLSAAALAGVFHLTAAIFTNRERGYQAAVIASLLCLPSFLAALTRGQLGVTTLFLALLVFWLYDRKKDFSAGFVLAFAVILKTTPIAPLGLLFILKREWRVVAGGIAGTFVFLWLIPVLALGVDKNIFYLKEWFRVMQESLAPNAHEGLLWGQLITPMATDNLALYAVLARLVWKDEATVIATQGYPIRQIVQILGLVLLTLLASGSLKRRDAASRTRLFTEFALFSFWMNLSSPVAESHHFTITFLMIAAAMMRLWETPVDAGHQRLLESGIWISALFYLAGLCFEPLSFAGVPLFGPLFLFALLTADLLAPRVPASAKLV